MNQAPGSCKHVKGWQWLALGTLFSGILVSALTLSSQTLQVRQQTRDLGQLRLQQDQARAEWGRLLLEQSTWTAYSRVERLATTHLAMRIPEAGEIRMLAAQ